MSTAISLQGLKRRALSLGGAKAFDQAMQFLLPIVLARCLDAATFGEYRLLWLVVGTVLAIGTLNMGVSLYYFLPRAAPAAKPLYVHNTMVFFVAAAALFSLLMSPWSPFAPASMAPLAKYGWLVPAFGALWFIATLLDYLPTIDERIGWQVWTSIGTAALRFALLAAGAWFTGDLHVILWLLLAVVVVKLGLLVLYVQRHHGLQRPWFGRGEFWHQLRYAAPFGASATLFSLRGQIDQWVAASLFALSSFAAFSIAALIGQVVHIFRHSVMEAFLPSMSRLEAAGDVRAMMEMNARANVMVGRLLYPILAIAFVFAEDIVTIVYTSAYVEAGPVVRLYVAGMAAMVVEIGSVVLLLRQGPYALRVCTLALIFSAAVSWFGARELGLAGAALGSVLAIYLDRALTLTRIARLTGIGLARLQHWRSLGWALFASILAASVAWVFTQKLLPDALPMVRVAAGTAVLLLTYVALQYRRSPK
jgi:O-antigen/teichoic acid export membrane protein